MKPQQQAILDRIEKEYPEVHCQLNFETPFQLAVAVILSAQCTDKRVNMVTLKLFAHCPDINSFVQIPQSELETLIHSTGFFRNKAKNIKALAKIVQEKFDGRLPKSLHELIQLPGVGRKTGNVIEQEIFGISEGIVMDTHAIRVSHRLGLSKTAEHPIKQERELIAILPQKYWYRFSHWMILLGRSVCIARKPKCSQCFLKDICPKIGV